VVDVGAAVDPGVGAGQGTVEGGRVHVEGAGVGSLQSELRRFLKVCDFHRIFCIHPCSACVAQYI
jgi:hypothetical protein